MFGFGLGATPKPLRQPPEPEPWWFYGRHVGWRGGKAVYRVKARTSLRPDLTFPREWHSDAPVGGLRESGPLDG